MHTKLKNMEHTSVKIEIDYDIVKRIKLYYYYNSVLN